MAKLYYRGPVSDHFDGVRFFNEGSLAADKNLLDVLRWSLGRKPAPWPKAVPSVTGLKPEASVEGLRITLIGHASLLVQAGGTNVLVDPVWAERASPVSWAGPRRLTPPAVALDDLPPIHAVLVTHSHYDHMDLGTLRALWRRDRPQMIAPLGNGGFLRKADPEMVVETGDWWQSFDLHRGLGTTMLPAYHWSSRRIGDYRKALWAGYMLHTPAGAVYLAGDTAYRNGRIFREIRERMGAPLVAVVPIGAYAPRDFMQPQHADPEEAVTLARDCGTQYALGVHWGTFHLSDEPLNEPAERFNRALESSLPLRGRALRAGDLWDAGEMSRPAGWEPA